MCPINYNNYLPCLFIVGLGDIVKFYNIIAFFSPFFDQLFLVTLLVIMVKLLMKLVVTFSHFAFSVRFKHESVRPWDCGQKRESWHVCYIPLQNRNDQKQQDNIYKLFLILFIRNSFKEYLYTLSVTRMKWEDILFWSEGE
jgi:hypothetical protein